jgi:hypothetical protein
MTAKQATFFVQTAYGDQSKTATTSSDYTIDNDRPQADAGMIAEAFDLYFSRYCDADIVCVTTDLKGAGYLFQNACDFRSNLEDHAKYLAKVADTQKSSGLFHTPICIGPNPGNDDWPQSAWGACSTGYKNDSIHSRHWLLFDIDRVDKKAPPSADDDDRLEKSKDHLVSILRSRGLDGFLITSTGNGWHVDASVFLRNDDDTTELVAKVYADLKDQMLAFDSKISFDTTKDIKRYWSLPGTWNLKYPSAPRLRLLVEAPSSATIATYVETNTEAFFSWAMALKSSSMKMEKLSLKVGGKDQAFLAWEADKSWSDILLDSGCKQYDKQGRLWTRPEKNPHEGPSLIVGEGRTAEGGCLYNLSSSFATFPHQVGVRKYRAHLMAQGVLTAEGEVVDKARFDQFNRDLLARYGDRPAPTKSSNKSEAPRTPAEKIKKSSANDLLNSDDYAGYIATTGTLDDVVLPADLEMIAQDIDRHSAVKNLGLSRAAAIAVFSFLVGRSVRESTGRRGNVYAVVLAKSCSGKASGLEYVDRLFSELSNYLHDQPRDFDLCQVTGRTFGSPEGIQDSLRRHGRILVTGDESEAFLLPSNSQQGAPAREAAALFRQHHNGKSLHGRTLAGGKKTASTDWPYIAQIHTTQGTSYWRLMQEEHATSGLLSRYLHFVGGDGVPKRGFVCDQIVSSAVTSLAKYWTDRNRRSLNVESYADDDGCYELGRFTPPVTTIKFDADLEEKRYQLQVRCTRIAQMAEHRGDYLMSQAFGRLHEQAQRLALLFTLAENREATIISSSAWALAVNVAKLSADVILNNCEHAGKMDAQKHREKILAFIRSQRDGVGRREIMRKFQSFLKKSADLLDHLDFLLDLGDIEQTEQEVGNGRRVTIYKVS